jgi:phosphonate degradation associated HDIG domain protein
MEHPDDILDLFRQRGSLAYDGEGVSQLQHAWQCARLAAQAYATPELQLACWLHDLGHLISPLGGTPTRGGVDDRHECAAAQVIEPLFGPEVAEPVALHVAAKRYLVATQPRYADLLSADSRRSLQLQGGPMDAREGAAFIAQPFAGDALRLRVWDERAKLPEWRPADTETALATLARLIEELRVSVS